MYSNLQSAVIEIPIDNLEDDIPVEDDTAWKVLREKLKLLSSSSEQSDT